MPVYIQAFSLVSGQETFGKTSLSQAEIKAADPHFTIEQPTFPAELSAGVRRRMSRLVRFCLTAAFDCMQQVPEYTPDAILTATGLGCVEDTGVFLQQMHKNQEKLLNPTAFIRSTHNAVGGQIALLKKIHLPNLTYTQKQASFETALVDASLLLDEPETEHVLVGGFDEITDLTISLAGKIGCVHQPFDSATDLLTQHKASVPLGEGAGFFWLTSRANSAAIASLTAVEVCRNVSSDLSVRANKFLEKQRIAPAQIDLLVLGLEGTPVTIALADLLADSFSEALVAGFRHLSGKFDTDTTFALWLGCCAIQNQEIDERLRIQGAQTKPIENVLIINASSRNSYSFTLLQKCRDLVG